MEKIEEFQKMYDECEKIVFFGGAGVSTESGIPDFRSEDGLYSQKWKYPPEAIVSRTFFEQNCKEFFRFYREKLIAKDAQPNAAHIALSKMEEKNKLKAIITQNIDGLHQKAGSKNVLELHGSTLRNYCTKCKKFYPVEFILDSENSPEKIPLCTECSSIVKPDVVLYEESLDENIIDKSIQALSEAELLIVGGTSLAVYPATGLINYFHGKYIVLINKSATSLDFKANLVFHESIGKVLSSIKI